MSQLGVACRGPPGIAYRMRKDLLHKDLLHLAGRTLRMGSILRNTPTGVRSFFRFDGSSAGLLPEV